MTQTEEVALRFHGEGERSRVEMAAGQGQLRDHSLGGQIGQQGAEGDRNEKQRFEAASDREVKKQTADAPHDDHPPRDQMERG